VRQHAGQPVSVEGHVRIEADEHVSARRLASLSSRPRDARWLDVPDDLDLARQAGDRHGAAVVDDEDFSLAKGCRCTKLVGRAT
jgi:hypothetical protein